MTSAVGATAPAHVVDADVDADPGRPATAPDARSGPESAATNGGHVGLVHEPALDGLRGLAVAVVVVFHLDRLQGGFLGVDLFFVLSGFLITSLLLTESTRTRAVDLGRFWARRARRLLPALLLVLVGVAVLLLALTPEPQRALFRGDMLATLGYVANWERVVSDASYWDMFSQPSPLDHMWSLAIEEQFYLLWPLVVLGLLRWFGVGRVVRAVGVAAVVGAVGSFAWLAASFDPLDTNWAYFSTPTRLGPTLLGATLAAVTVGRPRRTSAPGVGWDLGSLAGLGVIAWLVVDLDGTSAGYYRGGLVAFTLGALVVIRGVTGGPPGRVASILSVPPLRALGTISYGVYLWHWPLIVYTTPDRAHLDGWLLDGLRVALTLAAATVSYVLVESPIRRRVVRGPQLWVAGAVAGVFTLVAVVLATSGTPVSEQGDIPDGPLAGTDTLFLQVPAEVPVDATRVLLVGDSGAQFLGPELVSAAGAARSPDGSGVSVAFSSEVACTPANPEGLTLQPDGEIARREPCHEHRRELWGRLVDEFDPDVVVYYLANAGGVGKARLDGEWVLDCDPSYDEYIADALRSDADLLGAGGGRVVFTTTPYLAVIDGRSKERVDCRNQTLQEIAAARPGTEVVDMNSFVLGQSQAGTSMFVDSVHLSPAGSRLVSEWLLPLVLPQP